MENKTKNKSVRQYKLLIETIAERTLVATTLKMDDNYMAETDKLIGRKHKLNDEISAHYDSIRFGRVGQFETVSEFVERMNNTLEVDEDGIVIEHYYKLGIQAIDDAFFDGKGVFQNSLISIGADSGVGKTTLALQIISSLAMQDVQSQFFSFEMGDRQFFNEISPQAKNKLKQIVDSDYADNLTLDFHSRDLQDLANSIQSRYDDGVRAFVIDSYLSIYADTNEFQKMKDVVDMLATLKKELGILIIIIAQISKSDSFNEIFDFHGGNILKYESDVAIFIKLLEGEEDTGKRHIHCEKNRIFELNQKKGIVTDYNHSTHKIEIISDYKDYGGVDKDGAKLKSLKFGSKK